MDFHCRSRGHKVKKEEGIPCKKCDYIAENKDDSWVHKKVHIPPEKLFECGDCVWCVIIYYYCCCYFRYYKGAETDWTTSDTTSTLRSDSHPYSSIVDARASLAVTCRYKIARFFGILQCYKIFFLISLKKRRSQGHQMKIEYESIALAKAEAKGPKEVANYRKKLAKDLKLAMKGAKT